MEKFVTYQKAVEFAITKGGLGFRTSLRELAREALKFCFRYQLPYPTEDFDELSSEWQTRIIRTTGAYRWKLKNEKGCTIDCRTYEGQPRRNMLDDAKVHISILGDLQVWLEGVDLTKLLPTLDRFHSIDQLKKAIEHIEQLSPKYDLMTV